MGRRDGEEVTTMFHKLVFYCLVVLGSAGITLSVLELRELAPLVDDFGRGMLAGLVGAIFLRCVGWASAPASREYAYRTRFYVSGYGSPTFLADPWEVVHVDEARDGWLVLYRRPR